MSECLLPCKTCPWRTENGRSVIPGYNQDLAENLLNTVGDGDAFRSIMACHNSTEKKMIPCKGYLAQEGWTNLNVRILVMQKEIPNPNHVLDNCRKANIELEPDYKTVLSKLSAPQEKI